MTLPTEATTTLHSNKMVAWTIQYLIDNPRTDYECPVLTEKFEALFPDECAEDILNLLYRQGIANKYAMREYYIDDGAIDIIDMRKRINKIKDLPDNTPIWDFIVP